MDGLETPREHYDRVARERGMTPDSFDRRINEIRQAHEYAERKGVVLLFRPTDPPPKKREPCSEAG